MKVRLTGELPVESTTSGWWYTTPISMDPSSRARTGFGKGGQLLAVVPNVVLGLIYGMPKNGQLLARTGFGVTESQWQAPCISSCLCWGVMLLVELT